MRDRRTPTKLDVQADYKRGFGWSLLFNVFTKVATPLIGVVVARRLGPEVMGMYMVLLTVMTFADLFRDAGVSRVYLNEQDPDGSVDRGYAMVAIVVGLALSILVALAAWPVGKLFGSTDICFGLLWGAAAVLLNGISTIPYAKLLRQGRFKEAAFAESLGSVASSAYALILVLFYGAGFWALASQLVVRSVLFLAITYALAPVGVRGADRSVFHRIAKVSGTLTGINVLWVVFSVGDQAIIGKMLGLAAGGLYGTGKMIVASADVLAKPLTQTITVAFSHRLSDPDQVSKTLYKGLLIFLIGVVPIYVAVGFLAKPLVLELLSSKYAGTIAVLPALCAYGAAVYVGSFASSALFVVGKPQVPLYGWIVTYFLLVPVLMLTWSRLPLQDLAWVFAGALIAVNVCTLTFAVKELPPSSETVAGVAKAVCALIATSACCALVAHLHLADGPKLAIALVVVPSVHLVALGTFYARKPLRMCSVTGVKELWRAL